MKDKIFRNLYLSVDYDYIKEDEKIIGHKFYLVATLPLLIQYSKKKRVPVKLKAREELPANDPELRSLFGKKASEEKREKYESIISKLVDRVEKALVAHNEAKKWAGKSFESITIVNIDEIKEEKNTGETESRP